MGIIKVAIADDHKIFRKGVILSLRPYTNIKFVLEAENGEELIKGIHYFYLNNSKKQIVGRVDFNKRPVKSTVYLNNAEVDVDNTGNFVMNVDEGFGVIKFHKTGYNCEQSPNYQLSYDQINKSVFISLRCIADQK